MGTGGTCKKTCGARQFSFGEEFGGQSRLRSACHDFTIGSMIPTFRRRSERSGSSCPSCPSSDPGVVAPRVRNQQVRGRVMIDQRPVAA